MEQQQINTANRRRDDDMDDLAAQFEAKMRLKMKQDEEARSTDSSDPASLKPIAEEQI